MTQLNLQSKFGFLLTLILGVSFNEQSSVQGCEMVSKGLHLQGVCGIEDSVYNSQQYCLQKCLWSPLCLAVVITHVPLEPCRVYFCSAFEPVVESFEYFAKECPSETTSLVATTDGLQTTVGLPQTSVSQTESTPDTATPAPTSEEIQDNASGETSLVATTDGLQTTMGLPQTSVSQTESTSDTATSPALTSEEIQENTNGQTAMWREESQARNKLNVDRELFSVSPLSIAQCCALCTENDRCNSFFYETISHRCRGHALIYLDTSSPEFTEHLGYLYYTRKY